jgi:hypothetical protein
LQGTGATFPALLYQRRFGESNKLIAVQIVTRNLPRKQVADRTALLYVDTSGGGRTAEPS